MEIKFYDIGDPPPPGDGEWPVDLVKSLLPCAHCGLPALPLGDLYGYQVVCAGSEDRSCAIQTECLITTPEQAAALAGLSAHHVREALHSKNLKGRIVGRGWRIKPDDLRAYVKKL